VLSSDRDQIICVQPEKLKDNSILNLHAIDFCPMPVIAVLEIIKLESSQVVVRWEVQNDTLVGGFTLDYHLTSHKTPTNTHKYLGPFERQFKIISLTAEQWYSICVQANGKYLRSEGNKPTPYVIDHQKNFAEYVTSNSKCLNVRTLADSERTLLSFSTVGIIVGVFLFVVLILTLCIIFAAYKFRGRRRRPLKNDVPEEYITYRHFSLPSSETVYS